MATAKRAAATVLTWTSCLFVGLGAGACSSDDGANGGGDGGADARGADGTPDGGGEEDASGGGSDGGGTTTGGESRDGGEGGTSTDGGSSPTAPVDNFVPRACTGAQSGTAVLCVDGAATGTPDGTATHPFTTVQAAVNVAKAGDVIQVAGGTYAEHVLVQAKALTLVGGFAVGFATRDTTAHRSTLSGTADNAVVTILNAGATTVRGFRITGGKGRAESHRSGGGIFASGGSPTLSFNLVEGNVVDDGSVESRGGGIFVEDAKATILGNIVQNNASARGSGIYVSDGDQALLEGNLVKNNVSDGEHGGGLNLTGTMSLVNNVVTGNEIGRTLGYGWGGGIYIDGAGTVVRLSFDIVTKNFAAERGSGIFVDNGAVAYLTHELVVQNACTTRGAAGLYVDSLDNSGNTGSKAYVSFSTLSNDCPGTQEGGNGVYVEGDGSLATVESSILWANGGSDLYQGTGTSITVTYSLTSASTPGTGNVTGDPLFASPTTGDYHVRSRSGRWDPGTGTFVTDGASSPSLDMANPAAGPQDETAPNGGRANAGIHGGTAEASRSP